MQHVINRQVIEMTLPKADNAFRVQQQVSNQFYRQILPVLERVFDALAAEGELISFDRLVIDMGAISLESIENGSWTEELYTRLIGQAEELIRDGGGRRKVVRRPIGAGIVEQWLSYMRTGRLPWNVKAIDRRWLGLLLEYLAADHEAVRQLRENISGHGVVLRRIVAQHDVSFLVSLAEVLTARNQAVLPAAVAELGLIYRILRVRVDGGSGVDFGGIRSVGPEAMIIWLGVLRLAAEEVGPRDVMGIAGALLRAMAPSRVAVMIVRDRLAGRLSLCEPLLDAIMKRDRVDRGGDADGLARVEKRELADGEILSQSLKGLAGGLAEGETGRIDKREMEEGIFVSYAGLVLLHPFLATFFARIGLVEDGAFVDEAARRRCLNLVRWLATGEVRGDGAGDGDETDGEGGAGGAPEYELVIAKVLCGVPLEEVVVRGFEPTLLEIEEANGLLDACLSQWTVLRNTSRAGLRGNFLNRDGKLYMKQDKLRLEVERSSIDVLLDHLPWNLSLVRLPWMKEILHVNWR